jgi:hypothetical protein
LQPHSKRKNKKNISEFLISGGIQKFGVNKICKIAFGSYSEESGMLRRIILFVEKIIPELAVSFNLKRFNPKKL